MALSTLLGALRTLFTGNGTLTAAFPGGMHLDEAPEGSAMPYLCYTVIAAPSDPSYGGVTRDDVQIQFTGWGPGAAALLAGVETFCAAVEAGLPTINARRIGAPFPKLVDKGVDGNDVCQCYTTYEFNVRG